jgi:hypothetical protein
MADENRETEQARLEEPEETESTPADPAKVAELIAKLRPAMTEARRKQMRIVWPARWVGRLMAADTDAEVLSPTTPFFAGARPSTGLHFRL